MGIATHLGLNDNFFEGQRGFVFEPLAFVTNSRFAAHEYVFDWIAAIAGLMMIFWQLCQVKTDRWLRSAFLLFPVIHAVVYIVAFFGLTRFRATIHPFISAWVALGLVLTNGIDWQSNKRRWGSVDCLVEEYRCLNPGDGRSE